VRLRNGKWQCAFCHAELDVPEGTRVRSMLIGRSGERNERALLVGTREIHRCEAGPPKRPEKV
jgi:hypothetical protein